MYHTNCLSISDLIIINLPSCDYFFHILLLNSVILCLLHIITLTDSDLVLVITKPWLQLDYLTLFE